MMFRSYSNISKYFLRDYGTIAMVIILVTMVTITTVTSSCVNDIFTCENIWIFSVAQILIKHWCLYNK